MATKGEVTYEVVIDNDGMVKSMKAVEDQTDKTGKNMQNSMNKSAMGMTKSIMGFAAVGIAGLGALGKATSTYVGIQNVVKAGYGDMAEEAKN